MNRFKRGYAWLVSFSFAIGLCMAYPACAQDDLQHSIDSVQKLLKEPLPDSSKAGLYLHLARFHVKISPYTTLKYAKEGIALCDNNPRMEALLLNIRGGAYQMLSEYHKALSSYFQSLRIWQKENDPSKHNKKIAGLYNNIGICHLHLKNYEQAKKYLLASIPLSEPRHLGIRYNNLGLVFNGLNRYEEAVHYYRKAIAMNEYLAYVNIGDVYTKLEKWKLAEYHYKKGLSLSKGDIYALVGAYFSLGQFYLFRNRLDEAEDYLRQAEKLADSSGIKISLEQSYATISQLYEVKKDYARSVDYYKKLLALKDTIYKETNTRQINEMQAKYELEQKDREIEIVTAKAEKEYLLRNFVIVVFVFILFIGIVMYRNVVLKQRIKHRMLNEKNALMEIQRQQDEKMIIKLLYENSEAKYEILKSKINPHFLFNCFTILSSLITRDPSVARQFVRRFSGLFRSVIDTSDLKLVSLETEMELVSHYLYLQKMRMGERLHTHISIDKEATQLAVPPFSIQMSVENAVKHSALPKERPLHIEVYTEQGDVVITNNFAESHDSSGTCMGQRNIKERYRMLSGREPLFASSANTYIVRLPLLEQHHPVMAE